jgi:hypothetical protein
VVAGLRPVPHAGTVGSGPVLALALVIAGAIVVRWVLVPILRRLDSRFAEPVRVASQVVIQLGVAVILGCVAVVLAQDDDALHLALAVLLGLLAALQVLVQAFVVWAYFRFPPD